MTNKRITGLYPGLMYSRSAGYPKITGYTVGKVDTENGGPNVMVSYHTNNSRS